LEELDRILEAGVTWRAESDQQPLGLRAERRKVAEVDGGRLVAQVLVRRPVEPEVDTLGEDVGRRHPVGVEERPFGVLAGDEPSRLELPQEPELTGF
jgi:hypothetical protein